MALKPSTLDFINGMFEAFGAWSVWANVRRLLRDRNVQGIVWQFVIVWCLWAVWNCLYYPSLGQWFSMGAGIVLALGNFVWLFLWIKILRSRA